MIRSALPPADSLAEPDPFYVAGGTMPRTAPSYVPRQADRDLQHWLRAGEFCYVLTSRQMGKSSLMVRTAARLRQEAGIAVASVDLTGIGQNLSPEQWYGGMLRRIGRQLGIEDEIDDYWQKHKQIGPLQRWISALGDVVLAECTENLVIFVDEIDAVRSLTFRTDEFFAGIRECYNRRATEPIFGRLTFCLLGVATPSHLIDDSRLTPFNIGRRVDLRDFLPTESEGLAEGLLPQGLIGPKEQVSAHLLERVLYWTDGHPYLTQRLCQAVAAERSVRTSADVDRLCREIFLGGGAQEKDDNLLFVRESLLRGTESETELSSLLRLYAGIRGGKRIEDDSTDPLITALRLSGITKVERGALRVRNRIYRRVFDPVWVAGNLPGAELRRHRAAYMTGVRRTLLLSGVVLAVVLVLAVVALQQARLATVREQEQRRLLFWADMKIAEQAIEQKNLLLATQMLARHRGQAMNSFVWRYLWKQCHPETLSLKVPNNSIWSAAFSPDGRSIAVGASDGSVHLWDAKTGAETRILPGQASQAEDIEAVAFSRDGHRFAAGTRDRVQIWSLVRNRVERTLPIGHPVTRLEFSPDGRSLVTDAAVPNTPFWNIETGKSERVPSWLPADPALTAALKTGRSRAAFTQTGMCIFTGLNSPRQELWTLSAFRKGNNGTKGSWSHAAFPSDGKAFSAAFSPNGDTVATSAAGSAIQIRDIRTGRQIKQVGAAFLQRRQLAFSPNSRFLVSGSGSDDNDAYVWDTKTGLAPVTLHGHTGSVTRAIFSPDSRHLVTVSLDGTAKVWTMAPFRQGISGTSSGQSIALKGFQLKKQASLFSFSTPDGALMSSHYQLGNRFELWQTKSGERLPTLPEISLGDSRIVRGIFRPNGHDFLVSTEQFQQYGGRGPMQVFDTRSGVKAIAPPEQSIPEPSPLAYSPDGLWLVMQHSGVVDVHNIAQPEQSFTLTGHRPHVTAAAFSSDGKLLVTGGWDKTARVWDLASHRLLWTLEGHKKTVAAVAFAPDGSTVATACADGVIRFWDLSLGREIFSLETGGQCLGAMIFTPDGAELKVAFGDGTVRSWYAAAEGDIDRWITEMPKTTGAIPTTDGQTKTN